MIVRNATPDDLQEYAGNMPPCQLRAMVGEIDGKIVGIGGLAFLKNGSVLIFLNADDIVREKGRWSLYRSTKKLIEAAVARGLRRINAIKSNEIEAAERFLMRLGFRHTEDGIFEYEA